MRIIPTATAVFNVSKLNMERNNVRALNQEGVLQATPKYNSSILEDLFLEDNAEFVRRTFLGWKELGEALILLKVWARQRSSIYAHDCLSGFLISVIMVYLTTKSGGKCINNSMNTMQIFRVTMDFIDGSNGIHQASPQTHQRSSFGSHEMQPFNRGEFSAVPGRKPEPCTAFYSACQCRLEISWRDAKYGQRIQGLNFSSF